MEKFNVAQGVANKLFATELAIDQAIAEASQLMNEMITARQSLRLSATVGDAAFSKVAATIATLSEARAAVVEAHGQLDQTKLRIGIRSKMIGGFEKEADARTTSIPATARQAS